MSAFSPYTRISDLRYRGLGPATIRKLTAKGLFRVQDLLLFFPIHYNNLSNRKRISELTPGEKVTIYATLKSKRDRVSYSRKIPMTEAIASDESGSIFLVWFRQPYLSKTLKTGMELMLFGKIDRGKKGLTMVNPTFRIMDPQSMLGLQTEIEPVYSVVERVSNRFLQGLIRHCIDNVLPCNFQVPEALIEKHHFPLKRECISQIHFPADQSIVNSIEETTSVFQQALIYEELFLFFVGILTLRRKLTDMKKTPVTISEADVTGMKERLPFELTTEQSRVLEAIYREFREGRRLVRLVQGDVGSGKTVVSLLAAMPFLVRGEQAAFMAPTEILAEQHFTTLTALLSGTNVSLRMLTGSIKNQERRDIVSGLASGDVTFVVGTHALIQPDITFNKLAFTIIDEQHRFGVEQREALVQKGDAPHILSLTATPIPRTLAMTAYGEYDYDAIRAMPGGRKEVQTIVKKQENENEVYEFARKIIRKRNLQAYFVYPLIEESEGLDAKSATEHFESLRATWFKNFKTALVHGKMKTDERSSVMDSFKKGDIDILFATTVIEVGVDVPNANVMVIQNAERFGLSQLHQLRGRIGRGDQQSYCFLIVKDLKGDTAFRRVRMMAKTSDGFRIAEEDLKIRGPGEFLGTRQSGLPSFKIADILRDRTVLEMARQDAQVTVASGNIDFLSEDEWKDRFGKSLV